MKENRKLLKDVIDDIRQDITTPFIPKRRSEKKLRTMHGRRYSRTLRH